MGGLKPAVVGVFTLQKLAQGKIQALFLLESWLLNTQWHATGLGPLEGSGLVSRALGTMVSSVQWPLLTQRPCPRTASPKAILRNKNRVGGSQGRTNNDRKTDL